MSVPDLLVARPYRARYRDVYPGDNAGQIVRCSPGWQVVEQRAQLARLMEEIPVGRCTDEYQAV